MSIDIALITYSVSVTHGHCDAIDSRLSRKAAERRSFSFFGRMYTDSDLKRGVKLFCNNFINC